MKISKENLLKKGNGSLTLGAIFSLVSLSCPCPVCIGSTVACIANSVREKLGIGPDFP